MNVISPAKINLFLSVGPRRADGLHELLSVMQAVSLFDELSIESANEISLEVSPSGAAPADESNLALRAARTLAAAHGIASGARMRLEKRIPVAAGLAGGSTDAAAALTGLNRLWGISASRKSLESLGASIGADVPFCLCGGAALVAGAGENLSPVPCPEPVWWVIAAPATALSTVAVYAEFDRLGGGEVGDPFEVVDALARADLDRLGPALRNDLEPAALSLEPGIAVVRRALEDAGALAVVLSGSGAAWIGLARDEAHACEVAGRARAGVARVEVVCSVAHGPRVRE